MERLNKLGLPVKYAIIGGIGVPLGHLIYGLFASTEGMGLLTAVLAGMAGGAAGGWIRQRRGKTK